MQEELLRSLGALSVIDYYKIAREKRSSIVEAGLSALEHHIDDGVIASIGNAVLDLSPRHFQQLSFRAFLLALPIFQVKLYRNQHWKGQT